MGEAVPVGPPKALHDGGPLALIDREPAQADQGLSFGQGLQFGPGLGATAVVREVEGQAEGGQGRHRAGQGGARIVDGQDEAGSDGHGEGNRRL